MTAKTDAVHFSFKIPGAPATQPMGQTWITRKTLDELSALPWQKGEAVVFGLAPFNTLFRATYVRRIRGGKGGHVVEFHGREMRVHFVLPTLTLDTLIVKAA